MTMTRPTSAKAPQCDQQEHEDAPAEFDDMLAGAQRRLRLVSEISGQPSEEVIDPDAIGRLSKRRNPVTRYFANRNARDDTMAAYRRRLNLARAYLIEAGMEPEFALVDLERFPWHIVSTGVATRFWEILHDRYTSHKSRENLLGALRQMVRQCAAVGLVSLAKRDDLLECLPVRSGPQRKPGRALEIDELQRLISAAAQPGTLCGIRDAAIIATFASTGIRVSELVDIDILDVDLDARRIWIRRTKGGRSHQVWLHAVALGHVRRWIEARGEHDGALFDSVAQRGRALTTENIRQRLAKAKKAAGLPHLTTHDFRRTFITLCLREGVDVFAVARLVGHKRVTTTMQYDRRSDAEDRAVIDSLPFPSLRLGVNS